MCGDATLCVAPICVGNRLLSFVIYHLYVLKSYVFVLYFQENKGFPDMKVIAAEFKDKPELKKYMKKLMPFVQLCKVQ